MSKLTGYLNELRKVDNEEVMSRIDQDGMDYTFTSYYGPGSFEDKTLDKLVKKYLKCKEDIEKHLGM